jgi:phosphoribosylanthranilate isomerase
MTRVKICGITSDEDVELCLEAGADALGFVVSYPDSVPWNLTPPAARQLAARVPPFTATVAVVGGDARTILELVERVEPRVVQLHRDEDAATVAAVRQGLSGTGVRVVKAVRIATDAGTVPPAEHWLARAREFVAAGADAILLDSKTTARPAGTGQAIDWQIARTVVAALDAPVMLAGGLTPGNVAAAVDEVRPYAVDVISALEDERHRKVRDRVHAFVAAARRAG